MSKTFFKLEMRKLNRFEKALNTFKAYKNPEYKDFYRMWEAYKALYEFSEDLVGSFYYKLYKKYGDSTGNRYKERLWLYVFHNKELPWFLRHDALSKEEYEILIKRFQSLQNNMKVALIDAVGELEYKKFANEPINEFYLRNIQGQKFIISIS